MEPQPTEPFEFSISVDDTLLNVEVIERLEKQLVELALSELAKVDLAATLVTQPLPTARVFGEGGGFDGGRAGGFVARA